MRKFSSMMVIFCYLEGAWDTHMHTFVKTQPMFTPDLCIILHINFTSEEKSEKIVNFT